LNSTTGSNIAVDTFEDATDDKSTKDLLSLQSSIGGNVVLLCLIAKGGSQGQADWIAKGGAGG